MQRDGGYEVDGTVYLGPPVHIAAAVQPGAFDATAGCVADATADAAIPVKIEVVNKTRGFAAAAAVDLLGVDPNDESRISTATFTPSGTCHEPGTDAYLAGLTSGGLQPGASTDLYYVMYVKNFFTPNAPEGDGASVSAVEVSIQPGTDDAGNHWRLATINGQRPDGFAVADTFRLVGA